MGRFGRGRSGGYGRSMGAGRGYWAGTAPGAVWGRGMGMGNPYPYCRFYPWMPRRWWAMGMNPFSAGAAANPRQPFGTQ